MQKQKSGKLVVITSIMGKYGLPLYSTYSASKHALFGFFESLRQELYNDNVSVLIATPGFINTDVSTKLLKEDGTPYGIKSAAQEKGMSANDCAKGIVRAIKNDRDHKYIGNYEIFSVHVKQEKEDTKKQTDVAQNHSKVEGNLFPKDLETKIP